MKTKILLLFSILLMASAVNSQTTLQNNVYHVKPLINVNDSTAVKPIVRRTSDGRDVTMSWAYLAAVLGGGGGDLQAAMTAGSVGSVNTDVVIQKTGPGSVLHGELNLTSEGAILTTGNAKILVAPTQVEINALSNSVIVTNTATTTGQPLVISDYGSNNTAYGLTGITFNSNAYDFPLGSGTFALEGDYPTQEEVEALINEAVGELIPLAGTEVGSPVTGNLEFDDAVAILPPSTGGIYFGDPATGAIYVSGDPGNNFVVVRHDDPLSVGLSSNVDFSANNDGTDRNIYPQTGWVKDYAVPYTGALGNVTLGTYSIEVGGVQIKDIVDASNTCVLVYDGTGDSGTKVVTFPNTSNTTQNVAYQSFVNAKVANDMTASTTISPSKTAVKTYIDTADATKITNGGDTTGATMNIGSNDAQTVNIKYNNSTVFSVNSTTGAVLVSGGTLSNSVSSRGQFGIGASAVSPSVTRNMADGVAAFAMILANTSSTGNIAEFNSNISGTTTNRAAVTKTGQFQGTGFRLSALNTAPSSSTDTGTTGEIRVTATYIYVCTATNTWVRSALATW